MAHLLKHDGRVGRITFNLVGVLPGWIMQPQNDIADIAAETLRIGGIKKERAAHGE